MMSITLVKQFNSSTQLLPTVSTFQPTSINCDAAIYLTNAVAGLSLSNFLGGPEFWVCWHPDHRLVRYLMWKVCRLQNWSLHPGGLTGGNRPP